MVIPYITFFRSWRNWGKICSAVQFNSIIPYPALILARRQGLAANSLNETVKSGYKQLAAAPAIKVTTKFVTNKQTNKAKNPSDQQLTSHHEYLRVIATWAEDTILGFFILKMRNHSMWTWLCVSEYCIFFTLFFFFFKWWWPVWLNWQFFNSF